MVSINNYGTVIIYEHKVQENPKKVDEAVEEIQKLLQRLDNNYPSETTKEKESIANILVDEIDRDPELTSRILSALNAGGMSALKSLLAHPAASFVIDSLKDWQTKKSKSVK